MITRFLKISSILILLLATTFASAQQKGFSVKVKFVDNKTGAGVEFVTVSVYTPGAASPLKYASTDAEGKVQISGLRKGKYVMKGDLLGYEQHEKEFVIDGKDVDLGKLELEVQVNYLEGAVVSEVGNAIIVKKDTITFNASSFKTTDNDVLEDLLKKLPGVEVSTDGTITSNGKTIEKIMINGKEFFLDDPQLASKNIPAKAVDKVKVVNKKSEQAEFTGIDDGEEQTVIDLSIARGMMDGWFGNVAGGAGSDVRGKDADGNAIKNDLRYQGAAMVANFSDSYNVAFIGNVNNTNNRGFNDLQGGMMGGMRGGGMRGGGRGGFGGRGNGISTSYMAGTTGGYTFEDKSEINGHYMFSGNEKVVEENTVKTTFKENGTTLTAKDDGYNVTNSYGHRVGARADWKISDNTSILFMPSFNFGFGDFEERSDFSTISNPTAMMSSTPTKVNEGWSKSTGDSDSQSANGRLLWRQRLGKPGRTISMNFNYSYSNTTMLGLNQSETKTYDKDNNEEIVAIDQQYDQLSKSYGLGGRMSYTEPLGRNFFAEANYSYNYNNSNSYKKTYDKDANGRYNVLDEEYSNDIVNERITQRAGVNLRKQEEKYNVTVGLTAQPQRTINVTTVAGEKKTIDQNVLNWAPNARVDYDINDNKQLRFDYRGRSNQPSITQMQPIADNSNPQRISLGNPSLNPSFSHNGRLEYRSTKMETFATFSANLNFTYNQSNIVNASWYDDNGVQYTVPMNNDKGSFSTNAFIMFNSPIAKSSFSIMSFTNIGFSTGVSFVGKDGIDSDNSGSFLNVANFTENMYQNASVSQNLRFTFRNDLMEFSLGGSTRYSQAWYTVTNQNVRPTWNNSINGSYILTSDAITISTNARYVFYYGYEQGYNEPTLVWNAEVAKSFLKKKLTLSLKAYDILNQSRNTYRTTTDNYVQDVYNNTLGRYVVLNLTYRFGTYNRPQGMGPGRGPGRGHGPRRH